jgi:hypothetical protein
MLITEEENTERTAWLTMEDRSTIDRLLTTRWITFVNLALHDRCGNQRSPTAEAKNQFQHTRRRSFGFHHETIARSDDPKH